MPKVHLRILVKEDGILYGLSQIKEDVLNDCVVQQGTLGGHFTHVYGGNEARCDEAMLNILDLCQFLGFEVHRMAFIVGLPLTLSIGEHPYHLG